MLDALTPLLGSAVTAYGVVAGASSLLQARRMARRGTSSDVSLAFLALYVAGYGLWLLYGLAIGSLPLILVDAVGLACGATTVSVAVTLRRRARRPGRPQADHRLTSPRERRGICPANLPAPGASRPVRPGRAATRS